MQIDSRYVGHVFLKLGERSFYLNPPEGESPDLSWLATTDVLIVTQNFPNGIRYRTANLRITPAGQATCNLVLADRMQARMEKRWFGPKREVEITQVILRTARGETTLARGPRCLYRVAA